MATRQTPTSFDDLDAYVKQKAEHVPVIEQIETIKAKISQLQDELKQEEEKLGDFKLNPKYDEFLSRVTEMLPPKIVVERIEAPAKKASKAASNGRAPQGTRIPKEERPAKLREYIQKYVNENPDDDKMFTAKLSEALQEETGLSTGATTYFAEELESVKMDGARRNLHIVLGDTKTKKFLAAK